MSDAIFADPRLAAVYDAFDGERDDLDAYVGIADELGARLVLDGNGFHLVAVREAPDRPGREFVFIAESG